MYKLSLSEQGVAGLLFSARGGKDIRPQLQGVCEGVGTINRRSQRRTKNRESRTQKSEIRNGGAPDNNIRGQASPALQNGFLLPQE
jgi:hypothetical protein